MEKRSPYSIFFFLLLCLTARGRLVSSAGVSCSAIGGNGGNCEELRWGEDGSGSGYNLLAGHNEATQNLPSYCSNSFTCQMYSSSSSSTASVPRNITVVSSPSNSSVYKVDLHIQWEDSIKDDASVSGYEVLVIKGGRVVSTSCGCLTRGVRQMRLRDVYIRTSNLMEIQVRSLPYTGESRDQQTASVPLRTGIARNCLASASNKEHCISPHHIMPYSLLGPSDVMVVSSYTTNSSSLMQVHLTWLYGDGLSVVIALNDHTHSVNAKGPPGCMSPDRTLPCFLSTSASGVVLKLLDASLNYTVDMYQFNSSLCPGLNPSHLLNGCNHLCCKRTITITPPLYATPTTAVDIAMAHDHHMTQPPTITPQTSTMIKSVHTKYLALIVSIVVVGVFIAALILLIIVVKKKVHCCHALPSKSNPRRGGEGQDRRFCSTGQSVIRNFSALHCQHPLFTTAASSFSTTSSPLSTETKSLHQFTTLHTPLSHNSPCTPFFHTSLPTISSSFPPCTSLFPSSLHTTSPSYTSLFPSSLHTTSPPYKSPVSTTTFASHPLLLESPHSPGSSPYSSPVSKPIAKRHQILDSSVLIIYSPSINDVDRELILEHLVVGLMQYGVSTHCHDTACIKSPCQWIEQEIRSASAVLCVCNEDFYREWDESPASGRIPVVGLLKHLVHATVSRGESLAKFATILLDSRNAKCIPSLYLQGEPRLFLVTEVEDIARFVRNVPSYTTPSL